MVSFSSTIEVGETPALAQDRARHLHRVNTRTIDYYGGCGHGGNDEDDHNGHGHGGKNEDVQYKERLHMTTWTISIRHGGDNW